MLINFSINYEAANKMIFKFSLGSNSFATHEYLTSFSFSMVNTHTHTHHTPTITEGPNYTFHYSFFPPRAQASVPGTLKANNRAERTSAKAVQASQGTLLLEQMAV